MTACAAGRLFSYWLRESNMESWKEHEECLMVSLRFGLMALPLENSSQQYEVDFSRRGLQSCDVALVHCDLSKCNSFALSREPSRILPPYPFFLLVAASQSCSGLFYFSLGLQQIVPTCFFIFQQQKYQQLGYHQKEKRKAGVDCLQKLLNCLFDSACSMQRMTPAGLYVICRISCSSMRQTPKMRTPFKGSVDWQSEVKTQLLLPWKLSLLPITILFDPNTVFSLPMMMLLYCMSCERTFCSRSITLTTFWQVEQKTAPGLNMQVTVGCTALQPGNPLMPLKGKKAVLRMDPRKALSGGGRQLKFFCRVYFRSLMAASVSRSKMGSMFKPEKQLCPATMIIMVKIISNLLAALFSIGIEYKELPSNFHLTAQLNWIIEISIKSYPHNIPKTFLLIRQHQLELSPFLVICQFCLWHDESHLEIELLQLTGYDYLAGGQIRGRVQVGVVPRIRQAVVGQRSDIRGAVREGPVPR